MRFASSLTFIPAKCLLTLLATDTSAQPDVSGYQLSWQDDFSGSSINNGLWTIANTSNTTNKSFQDYLPSHVALESGNLVITSENAASRGLPYRSGSVTSTAVQNMDAGMYALSYRHPTECGLRSGCLETLLIGPVGVKSISWKIAATRRSEASRFIPFIARTSPSEQTGENGLKPT